MGRTPEKVAIELAEEPRGVDPDLMSHAEGLFDGKRIRLRLHEDGGFEITLDGKVKLFFLCKDDEVKYDGWEAGDYTSFSGMNDGSGDPVYIRRRSL